MRDDMKAARNLGRKFVKKKKSQRRSESGGQGVKKSGGLQGEDSLGRKEGEGDEARARKKARYY